MGMSFITLVEMRQNIISLVISITDYYFMQEYRYTTN